MKLIKITLADGQAAWLNPEYIVSLCEVPSSGTNGEGYAAGMTIIQTARQGLAVCESLEEVLKLIEANGRES